MKPSDLIPSRLRSSRLLQIGVALAGLLLLIFIVRMLLGTKVAAAEAKRRDVVETLVVNGRVLAREKSEIGSAVTGVAGEVLVDEGAAVHEGDLLVRLDQSEARASVAQARTRVAQAMAKLDTMGGATRTQNDQTFRRAQAVSVEAQQQLRRAEKLRAEGIYAQEQVEAARRAAEVARADAAGASAGRDSTRGGGSEERAAAAAVEEARALLAAETSKLDKTEIRAPKDGIVLQRSVQPGTVVQPGKTLFTIALATETLLLAQPDEKNLSRLHPGEEARASADAYPDRSFPARVSYVSPSVDLQRGTVDVRLSVPSPPDYLRTDMTLSIEIVTGGKKNALVVPADTVRDPSTSPFVLVARNGHAVKQPVKLGIRAAEIVQITSGLKEGEKVIPLSAPVREGDRVRAGGKR